MDESGEFSSPSPPFLLVSRNWSSIFCKNLQKKINVQIKKYSNRIVNTRTSQLSRLTVVNHVAKEST